MVVTVGAVLRVAVEANLRAKATELVDSVPENGIHGARGATMDRHDIVALALPAVAER